MKRAKSDDDEDRLSELPQSLIFLILSFLEMRDVVKTSLLSKHWKDLWMTTPYLCFEEITSSSWQRTRTGARPTRLERQALINHPWPSNESRDFINRALMLWQGSSILKFKINLQSLLPLSEDMDLWLRLAMRWNVQEVELIRHQGYRDYSYGLHHDGTNSPPAPHCLYSCSSIARLSLINYHLGVGKTVLWNQLKSLTICVSSISQDSIDHVLSGSPRLETFVFQICARHDDLSIRSSSLKQLSICSTVYDPSTAAKLTICAPKIEALAIQGAPHSKCLLMNALYLSRVNLDFTLTDAMHDRYYPLQDFALSPGGFKMVVGGVMKGVGLNAKMLRVRAAPFELVFSLVELFPKLETLAIDLKQSSPPEFELAEAIFPMSPFLMQLRTVEITWYKYGASLFQVMEFLLKHASILAKMVIRNGNLVTAQDLLLVARKLLNLQRSYQSVNILVHQK